VFFKKALEGEILESPGSIRNDGHESVAILDAKHYLTDKKAEVRRRVEACFHELESLTRPRDRTLWFGFNSAAKVLVEARASAAKLVPHLETDRRRYRLEEPETDGVSQREIFEIGRARRILPDKWKTNRYTPSLLYMLQDPAKAK
jgi:hypothetical protein